MAHIVPFRAMLYNEEKVGGVDSVVAPPWDVISPELQEELYRRSQWNAVRLIFGKQLPGDNEQENRDTRANAFWKKWLQERVLVQDPLPAIYVCRETYSLPTREEKTRWGFIALIRLEEFTSGVIHPHENTIARAKTDRMGLIRNCKANFSPILSLYSDPELTIEKTVMPRIGDSPDIRVTNPDGVKREIYRVTQPELIEQVTEKMEPKVVFIADGHHRYETALAFRDEMRRKYPGQTGGWDYVLMYFTNLCNSGLTILPVHRVLKGIAQFDLEKFLSRIEEFFYFESLEYPPQNMLNRLQDEEGGTFGLYASERFFLFKLKDQNLVNEFVTEPKSAQWRRLDVAILHSLVIRHILGIQPTNTEILYSADAQKAVSLVKEGQYQLALFLKAVTAEQLETVAGQDERMPPKSTYFYPKVPSGLVMNKIL